MAFFSLICSAHFEDASDVELRNKALELIVDLVTTRTVDDLTGFLRKELIKASASASSTSAPPSTESSNGSVVKTGGSDEDVYRHALVRAIRAICMKFPNCLPAILPTLCDVGSSLLLSLINL